MNPKFKCGQLCVLCGEREATERDHLPPECIYPKPRNFELHKVPACHPCNNGHSKEDEEFKVFITFDTSYARGNDSVLIGRIAGTVKHNPRIANQIFGSAQKTFAPLGTSSLYQRAYRVVFNKAGYNTVMKHIVRGLYWKETQEILPQSARITICPAREAGSQLQAQFKEVLKYGKVKAINDQTVTYRYFLNNDGLTSVWGICFFKAHIAFACVNCVSESEDAPTCHDRIRILNADGNPF